MKVFVYWNFNRKLWSLRSVKTRKVVGYRTKLCLRDCVFKVSQAGRNRVLAEKRKNVHAGVVGTTTNHKKLKTPVGYNPYKYKTFINKKTLIPVSRAEFVSFDSNGKCMMGGWR